jgi:hypothetical protein
MKDMNKYSARVITAISLAFSAVLLGGLTGCSKTEDEQLKEDVAAIRAIKEKEQADQEASKQRHRERLLRAAADVSGGGAQPPASAASVTKAASK